MNKISRRNFIRASALSALGAAAAGALSGCSNNAASSAAASSVASSAAASEQPAAAASAITWDDIFATSYSQANRRSNPDAKAPETPEEYIEQKGNGDIMGSMMVGMVDSLNIPEEQFMNNKPAWLGDEPQLADKVEYTKDCEVLVIGAGQAGTAAALRCAEEGLNTICCEVQTWEEYDNYACDLTTYNSKFFLDKGAEKYDPMDIFTEYMVKALGHANQKIVKDYATRSGEALDWMLAELDPDYVAKYAHAVNYKGNKHFQNPCSHSYYYVGMTQWRDTGTDTNTNNNMWPYTVRLLQQKAVEKGCEYIYGAQGLTLVHENGKVTGAIFTDIDGKYFQVNADAVIVAAGDFGGNPDMRLDLCDTLRNLAWSYGKDRTDGHRLENSQTHRHDAAHESTRERHHDAEHLGDFLDDRLDVQCLIRSNIDQTFASSDIHAAKRFQVIADAIHQHPLKIWFIHALQGNLTAANDENVLFIHGDSPIDSKS